MAVAKIVEDPVPRNVILQGDALMTLRRLPSRSVQCVVTSPPYWGLRDYGVPGQLGLERTPEGYVSAMVAIFDEVRRVLYNDGTLWLNMGDAYANDTKWGGESGEINDTSRRGGYRGQREKRHTGLKPKDLIGMPWRVAFALQADGWWLRSDIVWSKPNPMPESVADRPTRSHEYLFLLTKNERYYYDAAAIRDPAKASSMARINQPNFANQTGGEKDYANGVNPNRSMRQTLEHWACARADKQHGHSRRHAGFNERWDAMSKDEQQAQGANKRSVWTVATRPFPEAHFATFPPALVTPCILAGSRRGDLVLDPFMGAGTVGLVARQTQRDYLGIELNPEYIAMAERRIATMGRVRRPAEVPRGQRTLWEAL